MRSARKAAALARFIDILVVFNGVGYLRFNSAALSVLTDHA